MLPVIEAKVLDRDYRIIPSFRVLDAWEERITIEGFRKALAAGETRFRDVAWVIWCSLRYGTDAQRDNDVPTYEEVGQWCITEEHHYESIILANDLLTAGVNPGNWAEIKKKMDTSLRGKSKRSDESASSPPTTDSQSDSGDGPEETSGKRQSRKSGSQAKGD